MARITLSGLLSDIRGKIQGSVFQQSQGGLMIRSSSSKVNKLSISQSVIRNRTFGLQQAWRSLTDTQRSAWSNFAKFNPVVQKNSQFRNLNGQQIYIKFNFYLLAYSFNRIDNPEFTIPATQPITASMGLNVSDLEITYSRVMNIFVEYVVLFCTDVTPQSVINPSSRYRLVAYNMTNGPAQNISTEYEAVFNRVPVSGDKIFFKLAKADLLTGIVSSFFEDSVIL